jgi:hypothetical protein
LFCKCGEWDEVADIQTAKIKVITGKSTGKVELSTIFHSKMHNNSAFFTIKCTIIVHFTFEIGGRNKKQKQIKGVAKSYIVKDDIEYGGFNVIPLWQFGLLY